ncbi:hypothetical protein D3C71_1534920 [compost metagenome]
MIRRKVDDHLQIMSMGRVKQGLKIGEAAEGRIGLLEIPGPITVVSGVVNAGIVDDGGDILDRLGNPDGRNPHVGQITVIDLVGDSLPVSSEVELQIGVIAAECRACRVVR